MLKEIYGELWFVAVSPPATRTPLATPLEQDEGAGGLELRLHPELCVGVVVGDVDTQTPIFTENDESGPMVSRLWNISVRDSDRELVK